jgi:hypothetical protein
MNKAGIFIGGYFPADVARWVGEAARQAGKTRTQFVKDILISAMGGESERRLMTPDEIQQWANERSRQKKGLMKK